MKHFTLNFLLCFVLIGSLYLIYIENIDGVYINQPFTLYVNGQDFKTDKQIYKKGDEVSIFTFFCKNRPYTTQTTWRLVDDIVTTFSDQTSKISTIGCLKNKYVSIGKIPPYVISGTYHLEGSSEIIINPLHTMYYSYRSQDFQVE